MSGLWDAWDIMGRSGEGAFRAYGLDSLAHSLCMSRVVMLHSNGICMYIYQTMFRTRRVDAVEGSATGWWRGGSGVEGWVGCVGWWSGRENAGVFPVTRQLSVERVAVHEGLS